MRVMEDNYRKKMALGQDGNALVQLVILNAIAFVILKFIYVYFLYVLFVQARQKDCCSGITDLANVCVDFFFGKGT